MKRSGRNGKDKAKNKKNKKAASLSKINASLLAMSLTSGLLAGPAATLAAPIQQPVQVSQPQVYTGDSLQYLQNMLSSGGAGLGASDGLTAGEDAPAVAQPRSMNVYKGQTAIGTLGSGQQNELNDGITYVITSQPAQGTLRLLNADTGSYEYEPSAGYEGQVTFEYALREDNVDSPPAVVTLTVYETDEQRAVAADRGALSIGYAAGDAAGHVIQSITLPVIGQEQSTIQWTSSHPLVISDTGAVTRQQHDVTVTLTATIKKTLTSGNLQTVFSDTKTFTLTVTAAASASVPAAAPDAPSSLIGAQNKDNRTPNVASLEKTKNGQGQEVAHIRVLDDGIRTAVEAAGERDVITIAASNIVDNDAVRTDFSGSAVTAMTRKNAVLAIQTGNLTVKLPANGFDSSGIAKQIGTGAEQLAYSLSVTKVADDALKLDRSLQPISPAYSLALTAQADGASVQVKELSARFMSLAVPVPPGLNKENATGVVLENGIAYPVPVTFNSAGEAVFHSTRSGTFLLVERRSTSFTDLEGHWSKQAVQAMSGSMVVDPIATGSAFDPDKDISRAEFASMLVRALGLGNSSVTPSGPAFHDVDGEAWYKTAVDTAVSRGLFKGFPEGTFAPDAPMTREQMAAVLVRAANYYDLQLPDAGDDASAERFKDYGQVSGWAKDEVDQALRQGLIRGMGNGTLASAQSGTRSQGAVLLLELLQRAGMADQ